jgi:hypothetical protein
VTENLTGRIVAKLYFFGYDREEKRRLYYGKDYQLYH